MEIVFHPLADDEFWDQVEYYKAINEKIANKFLDSFSELVDGVSRNPYLCHNRGDGIWSVRVHGFPFSVFYKIGNGRIFILSVCHERRNPSVWKVRK